MIAVNVRLPLPRRFDPEASANELPMVFRLSHQQVSALVVVFVHLWQLPHQWQIH